MGGKEKFREIIYLNKKSSNNHSYKISGSNHYICRKCNTINTIDNLETSLEKNNRKNKCICCGKQLTNEKQHIFLHQNRTTGTFYTDWEADCVIVSYYPDTDVLSIRVQEIKYAGKSGCKAVCQKRYTTGIFNYKKKQIYTFSNNKVSNVTFKHLKDNILLTFDIISVIKYKVTNSFTPYKIKGAVIRAIAYKYDINAEELSKKSERLLQKLIIENAIYYACNVVNGEIICNTDITYELNRYNSSLIKELRKTPNVSEEDVLNFKEFIKRKCINPYNKNQVIPESEAGVLRQNRSVYSKNLNIFKKYIAKFPNYPKKDITKGGSFIVMNRSLFNKYVDIFPEELAFYFIDKWNDPKDLKFENNKEQYSINEYLVQCNDILKKYMEYYKLPDKNSKNYLEKLFKACRCPMTKTNKKLFMQDPIYIFLYNMYQDAGFINPDCLRRMVNVNITMMSQRSLNSFDTPIVQIFNEYSLKIIKKIIEYRGEVVFAADFEKMLNTASSELHKFVDAIEMLDAMDKHFPEDVAIARNGRSLYKLTIKELHDEVSFVSQSLRYKNVELENLYTEENLTVNDDIQVSDKIYHFNLVKNTNEMIQIGQALGICVGTAYRDNAIHKISIIAEITDSENKYLGCIELSPDCKSLRQVKGYHNSYLSGDTAKAMVIWTEKHNLSIKTTDYKNMNLASEDKKYAYGNRDFHNPEADIVLEGIA